jgi:hypothetical protein
MESIPVVIYSSNSSLYKWLIKTLKTTLPGSSLSRRKSSQQRHGISQVKKVWPGRAGATLFFLFKKEIDFIRCRVWNWDVRIVIICLVAAWVMLSNPVAGWVIYLVP